MTTKKSAKNIEDVVGQLEEQLAALRAQAGLPAPKPTPKSKPSPKTAAKKDAVWTTVAAVTVKAPGGKTGTEVAHARFGGKDYVSLVRTVKVGDEFHRKKGVAVEAAALKAALAKLDI